MPKESMTPKERWLAVLSRKNPDRIPMDYWATPETTASLLRHLGCSTEEELCCKLHVDMPVKVNPEYVGPSIPKNSDIFGCRYKNVNYGTGIYQECYFHPLAPYNSVSEVKRNFRWPKTDWWDYSSIRSQIHHREDFPILAGHYEPFLIYKDLRGQQQAFMDMVENPDLVHYCLDKLFYLGFTDIQRMYEQIPGKVMLTYVAEDMGGQEDLMMSPEHIREFLVPKMKKVIDFVHSQGAYAFHHNDGSIRRIIPDMVAAGIDILNPIQWRSKNMDRKELKKDFGDDVILHGAMDNQLTLPFGSVKDVRSEVLDNFRILGADGGYILAPCHNIQSITPVENILTMYETGYEYGWR
jgi:uroporphyrinogen decarboxylase